MQSTEEKIIYNVYIMKVYSKSKYSLSVNFRIALISLSAHLSLICHQMDV